VHEKIIDHALEIRIVLQVVVWVEERGRRDIILPIIVLYEVNKRVGILRQPWNDTAIIISIEERTWIAPFIGSVGEVMADRIDVRFCNIRI